MNRSSQTSKIQSLKKKRNLRLLLISVAVAVIFTFVPKAMFIESEVGMRILITCLGIDTVDNGYDISAQVFLPVVGNEQKQEKRTISVTAPTVSEAIDKVSVLAGRLANVTHCKLILLGPRTLEADAVAPLDYFLRSSQINWSALIVATEKSAKETLELITSMEKDVTFSWQKYLLNNKKNALIAATDFKDFMNGQYSESKTSYISLLDIEDPNEPSKDETVAAASGGEGKAEGGEEPTVESRMQAEFDKKSKTVIVRGGQKIGELNAEQTYAVSWFDPLAERYILSVSQVGGKYFGDEAVAVKCSSKRISKKVDIIDGRPVVKYKLTANFTPMEVAHKLIEPSDEQQMSEYRQGLELKIEEEIRASINSLFVKLKELDADILEFEQDLKRFHYKKYRDYKASHSGGNLFRDMLLDADLNISVVLN